MRLRRSHAHETFALYFFDIHPHNTHSHSVYNYRTVYEPSLYESFSFSSAGKTIQLSNGRTLAYLESGDPKGLPVFFFHGGPGSRLDGLIFDELNQQLGIRMITLDCPGYGLSD